MFALRNTCVYINAFGVLCWVRFRPAWAPLLNASEHVQEERVNERVYKPQQRTIEEHDMWACMCACDMLACIHNVSAYMRDIHDWTRDRSAFMHDVHACVLACMSDLFFTCMICALTCVICMLTYMTCMSAWYACTKCVHACLRTCMIWVLARMHMLLCVYVWYACLHAW